jgi:alpha,alpha-trehalose phosphorylase
VCSTFGRACFAAAWNGCHRPARRFASDTHNGVHIASLAGAWTAAVAGFGGMRDHGGAVTFAPRLSARLERLAFRLLFRGRRLRVDVTKQNASYVLVDGDPLEIAHHGQTITIAKGEPVTYAVPPASVRPVPSQPAGRTRAEAARDRSAARY